MSYCTEANIKSRIPEKILVDLTQDDKNQSELNTDRLTAAIFDADAIIDSKLRTRYVLPMDTVPNELIRIAVDLTVYFLYRARYDNALPDMIKESFSNALSYLNALQTGDELLDAETNGGLDGVILTNQHLHDLWYSKRKLRRI